MKSLHSENSPKSRDFLKIERSLLEINHFYPLKLKALHSNNKAKGIKWILNLFLFVFMICPSLVFSQANNVGIGTTTPDESAVLDLVSTTQGLLPPRMTALQRNSIVNPVAGLIVWCSDCGENGEFHSFCYDGAIFKHPVTFQHHDFVSKTYKLDGNSYEYLFSDIS